MRLNAGWLVLAAGIAGIWTFTACGQADEADPGATDDPVTSEGGASSSSSSSSGASGSSTSSGGENDDGGSSGGANGATEPNLKVAFIGDTAAGKDFRAVLELIKREKADALMVQGDLTYGNDAEDWFNAIDNSINQARPGSEAAVTIPYFVSKGNHDRDWKTLGSGLNERLGDWSVPSAHNDPTKENYSVVYKGLKMVMVTDRETRNPTRAEYIDQQLANDKHIWKICSWHKNQRASNVGPKDDDMGWEVYETCRKHGAIVAQGHSHTYSRSKTLLEDATQKVDDDCSDPFELCVGPGKHFFFDSSLGGVDTRSLNNTIAKRPHWAASYTGSYGALFIEFNVDGDPKKAKGYFKNVGDEVIDPPASSKKTEFTITRTP